MTVIVGLVAADRIIMGADSGVTIGDVSMVIDGSKIARFRRRGKVMLAAASGAMRACQVAERALEKLTDADAIPETLVAAWASAGIDADDNAASATVMAAARRTLTIVYPDGSAFRPGCGFAAIGSGGAVAVGALDAYGQDPRYRDDPESIVRLAMMIAGRHVVGIREPFFVTSTKD